MNDVTALRARVQQLHLQLLSQAVCSPSSSVQLRPHAAPLSPQVRPLPINTGTLPAAAAAHGTPFWSPVATAGAASPRGLRRSATSDGVLWDPRRHALAPLQPPYSPLVAVSVPSAMRGATRLRPRHVLQAWQQAAESNTSTQSVAGSSVYSMLDPDAALEADLPPPGQSSPATTGAVQSGSVASMNVRADAARGSPPPPASPELRISTTELVPVPPAELLASHATATASGGTGTSQTTGSTSGARSNVSEADVDTPMEDRMRELPVPAAAPSWRQHGARGAEVGATDLPAVAELPRAGHAVKAGGGE